MIKKIRLRALRLRQWDGASGKRASHRLSWRASRPLSSCAGCEVVSRTVGNFVHLGRWVGGLIIVSVSQDNPNYVSQEQLGRVSVCSEDETAGEGDGKPSENRKTEFPPPPTTPPSPSRARTRSRYQPRGDLREQTGGQTVTFCFFISSRMARWTPVRRRSLWKWSEGLRLVPKRCPGTCSWNMPPAPTRLQVREKNNTNHENLKEKTCFWRMLWALTRLEIKAERKKHFTYHAFNMITSYNQRWNKESNARFNLKTRQMSQRSFKLLVNY